MLGTEKVKKSELWPMYNIFNTIKNQFYMILGVSSNFYRWPGRSMVEKQRWKEALCLRERDRQTDRQTHTHTLYTHTHTHRWWWCFFYYARIKVCFCVYWDGWGRKCIGIWCQNLQRNVYISWSSQSPFWCSKAAHNVCRNYLLPLFTWSSGIAGEWGWIIIN